MNWYRLIWLTKYFRINIFSEDRIFIKFTTSSIPDRFNHLLIIHFFKNSVTTKYNKIKTRLYLKTFDIWNWNNTFWITSISLIFSFNISDCSWYRQSSRKYSMRSNYHLKTSSIVRRRIRHITFILIYLSSIRFNSSCFFFIFWLVIMRQ